MFQIVKIGNNPHFEYHKYKCRESILKQPEVSANGKKSITALTDSCMGQTRGGKMLDESRNDDDNSHRSITEGEKVLRCRQDDQVFNSWDTLTDCNTQIHIMSISRFPAPTHMLVITSFISFNTIRLELNL